MKSKQENVEVTVLDIIAAEFVRLGYFALDADGQEYEPTAKFRNTPKKRFHKDVRALGERLEKTYPNTTLEEIVAYINRAFVRAAEGGEPERH